MVLYKRVIEGLVKGTSDGKKIVYKTYIMSVDYAKNTFGDTSKLFFFIILTNKDIGGVLNLQAPGSLGVKK